MENGSGDYAIAFSAAKSVRRTPSTREKVSTFSELPNTKISALFQCIIEATEEAIYNSLFKATTMTGYKNTTIESLPLDKVRKILKQHGF
jgi:D-aminopeptidase